jgi:hypothetical protein
MAVLGFYAALAVLALGIGVVILLLKYFEVL